jgi:G:T-mismatch repair DNA endonuclease (very short patch repair protein)
LIEEMARTVVSRTDATSSDAADVAVRTVLSIAGLSWREIDDLLTAHPDIDATAPADRTARA